MEIEVKYVPCVRAYTNEKYTAVYFNNVRVGFYTEVDALLVDRKVWAWTNEEPFDIGYSKELVSEERMKEFIESEMTIFTKEEYYVISLLKVIDEDLENGDWVKRCAAYKHLKNIYYLKGEMKRLEEGY